MLNKGCFIAGPETQISSPNYVPQFGPQPLAQAKIVTTTCENKNYMQLMRRRSIHQRGPICFSFWVGRGGGKISHFSLFSKFVPKKFPKSSHQVPNVFSKFSICSPAHSQQHPTLISYALTYVVLFSPLLVWRVQLAQV